VRHSSIAVVYSSTISWCWFIGFGG